MKIQAVIGCFVETSAGEVRVLPGIWELPAQSIHVATNAPVSLSGQSQGATVLVDADGQIIAFPPPDYAGAWVGGFALGIGVLGLAMVVRWVVRFVGRKIGAGTVE